MGSDSPHEPKPTISCPNCSHLIDFSVEPDIKPENYTFLNVDDSGKKDKNDAKTEMDAKIVLMDYFINNLIRQRAVVSQRRNQYAPVGRLPVEILSEIFRCTFFMSGQDDLAFPHPTTLPLLLGKICSQWRNIAWSLSELWSTFHCVIPQVPEKKIILLETLLKEWITRSRMRLLSIRISFEDRTPWTSDAQNHIIEALIPHCRRWKGINLTLPEGWYYILEGVRGKLDNLASITICPTGQGFVIKPLNFFFDAPLLHSLTSSNHYLHDLQYPWTQLTVASFGSSSTDEAIEIISRCPNLVTCRFENLASEEGSFSLENILHKNIQHLTVALHLYTPLSLFFDLLALPGLAFLALILPDVHSGPLPIVQRLIERSECSLKTIQITGVDISSEDLIEFLACNKGVRSITNNPAKQIEDPSMA